VPKHPFDQGRRFRLPVDRHGRVMEEVIARLVETAKRHGAQLDEQRTNLSHRLRLRGGWNSPRPLGRPRRKPGGEPESGGVPAVPDRPKNLSGGAAAALEFEAD
jgi:hypothetical protein